jgi:hypothetical protein
MAKGYGLFGELTLEGYVGEYFGVDLRKREAPGGGIVLKVSPKPGQNGITSGVFNALLEEYAFVGVGITEFGTLEATFEPKTTIKPECNASNGRFEANRPQEPTVNLDEPKTTRFGPV